jgi:hypothetical protein
MNLWQGLTDPSPDFTQKNGGIGAGSLEGYYPNAILQKETLRDRCSSFVHQITINKELC